jgi:chemotaxis protein CheC
MVSDTVELHVPSVTLADIVDVPDLIGGPEQIVVGITMKIQGDACGNILLVFPEESAHRLVNQLLDRDDTGTRFDEMAESTLKEVGNILASSYLGAMGSLLNLMLIPSVPAFAHDMSGAVIDYLLIELSETGDQALMIETEFHGRKPGDDVITGHFFLLPDPVSLKVLVDAIGATQ